MDYKISFVAVVACALFACALGELTVNTTTLSTSTTTSSITEFPETTTVSTTPAPSTSTTPSSTTPSSTTEPTSTTTTTTTAKPTTPAPAPSTTVAPPSGGRGNWTVSNETVICIMAQMAVSAKITYPLNEANKTGTAEIKVPEKATATGACELSSQNVKITWGQNSLELVFAKDDSTKQYYINHISLSVLADEKTFPNISSSLMDTKFELERKATEFNTTVGQSYRCIREESLPLSKPNTTSNDAVLVLNNVQLQAFHDKEAAKFGDAQDCELDTPDIVPIAVGCALAALVCVVLVAYLVGRRRSQARGYLSIFLD